MYSEVRWKWWWNSSYVECWVDFMFGMCNVADMGCWQCGIFGMSDIRDVGCWQCGVLRMWNIGDVGCGECGMLGMWDVRDVGCGMFAGMWDVDLQNALLISLYSWFWQIKLLSKICFSNWKFYQQSLFRLKLSKWFDTIISLLNVSFASSFLIYVALGDFNKNISRNSIVTVNRNSFSWVVSTVEENPQTLIIDSLLLE